MTANNILGNASLGNPVSKGCCLMAALSDSLREAIVTYLMTAEELQRVSEQIRQDLLVG